MSVIPENLLIYIVPILTKRTVQITVPINHRRKKRAANTTRPFFLVRLPMLGTQHSHKSYRPVQSVTHSASHDHAHDDEPAPYDRYASSYAYEIHAPSHADAFSVDTFFSLYHTPPIGQTLNRSFYGWTPPYIY